MPNNLLLAVEIAELAARAPASTAEDASTRAQELLRRHPESDVRVAEVAAALQDESAR